MENENKFEGFTLSLALVDALPVIFFGASSVVVGLLFKSPLFVLGAVLSFLGGASKVMWKLILALKKQNIAILNCLFRYLMAGGFLVIILSLILGIGRISLPAVWAAVTGAPQCVFFLLWLCGMLAMCVLSKTLDGSVAKNNWIEQCVNAFSQACLLTGLELTRAGHLSVLAGCFPLMLR